VVWRRWPHRRPAIGCGRAATQHVHPSGLPPTMEAVKVALIGLGVVETSIKTEAFRTIKRDPTARHAMSSEIAGRGAVSRLRRGRVDVAGEADIFIDNACRSATCGPVASSCYRATSAWLRSMR
jgi:hypothetical protein